MAIQRHDVEYGLLNTDIAAYHQQRWQDNQNPDTTLVIVKTLPIQTSVKFIEKITVMQGNTEFLTCLARYVKEEALADAVVKFRKKIEVSRETNCIIFLILIFYRN